ncbi:hypothetical protein ACTQ50_19665 [Blautia sp. Sow4_E7]|uniref:hypothetical protein n=1 Tax=Blautia sp. Sow4_E7 TaxID=3438749 RepID=UPI003F907C82
MPAFGLAYLFGEDQLFTIYAFSQEAGANVAMHGAPGFGIYGVDIFVKTDDAEKAVQLIKEINNQE